MSRTLDVLEHHAAMQVVWVDLLSKAEFEAGFGSHTPIFTGQTKCDGRCHAFQSRCPALARMPSRFAGHRCVRYYMNFGRAMAVLKEVLGKEGRAFNARDEAGAHAQLFAANFQCMNY